MTREHLVLIIARMYKEVERLSQLDFQDADKNNLRDDLSRFAQALHSLPRQIVNTGNQEQIAHDAETITEWAHCLMNSYGITINRELEYVVRLMAAHWGITPTHNVLVFAHGDFAVRHLNKIDAIGINVLEKNLKQRFTKEPRIVFLPQLYDGDFLFSSILFHEVGHMVERDNGLAEIIYPKISSLLLHKPNCKLINAYFKSIKESKTTTETIIKSHIKEHIADLFGCQYLGNHILEYVKYRESSGRNVDRYDHPTYACRERLIQSMVAYLQSPTHTTNDDYLNMVIDAFHNTNGIDDLCQHYVIHPEANIEQGNPIIANTEEDLFSLFFVGWRVATKGLSIVEQHRGEPNGTLTYQRYYSLINDGIRDSIRAYMSMH